MEKVKQEITHTAEDHREWHRERAGRKRKEKTAEQRREKHLVSGTISFFTGIGLALVLGFVGNALLGKFPPALIDGRAFDFDSLLRIAWVIGLLPTFAGFGHIIAGLTIRRHRPDENVPPPETPLRIGEPAEPVFAPGSAFAARQDDEATVLAAATQPDSVTERTTNILEHKPQVRWTDEM
ncbi:MAG: hypothetical protein ACXWID_01785 [Pyrinomonadaceae bacterium]